MFAPIVGEAKIEGGLVRLGAVHKNKVADFAFQLNFVDDQPSGRNASLPKVCVAVVEKML